MSITDKTYYIKNLEVVIESSLSDRPSPWNVKQRHSDALVYVISGNCNYTFGNKTITVKEGDVVYLASKSDYHMALCDNVYSFIYCDFEFFDSPNEECCVFSPENSFETKNLYVKLLKHYKNSELISCMSVLYAIYEKLKQSNNRPYIGRSARQKILSAKDYIDRNFYDSGLSISFLAKSLNFSQVYFRKLFKAFFGITPSEYIITSRLKEAEKLLKYPFLTIEECALKSGFSSSHYFSRAFKKHMGITPSENKKRGCK